MDYLDPEKQRKHSILLLIGYVLITIAVVTGTIILVYQAYGFGIDRNGTVIQNGLVFFSSQPNPANIYIGDKLTKSQTNTRATLAAGIYNVKIAREGYQDWRRTIEVNGGSVSHFDYPLLLPKQVKSTSFAQFAAPPSLVTQSLDKRWLLVAEPSSSGSFQVFDLKGTIKPAVTISLPNGLFTKPTSSELWNVIEWADDNQHVLLKHTVDTKPEYVLVDRQNPELSQNLSQLLGVSPTKLTLADKKFDKYYLYNSEDRSLQTANLKSPAPLPLQSDVLAYKTYGNDTLLFFTSADAPAGKVTLKLQTRNRITPLRSFAVSSNYLLDIAVYNNKTYIVASSTDEDKVYVYKDPLSQLANLPAQVIIPVQILRVTKPDYVSFSSTAQYLLAEHAEQIAVYDIENKNTYKYVDKAIDQPQGHIGWMDGNRLAYTSNGMLQIHDYDQRNARSFALSSAMALPIYAPNYYYLYSVVPTATGASLNVTPLRIPGDL